MDGWIVIPNWRRFQHYKNRQPKWIKVYTELMSDPAFRALTLAQRGLLISLWLEYANSRASVTIKPGYVTQIAGQRVRKGQLEALIDAGFIEVSASRPLAERYQAASAELSTSYLTKSGDARATATGAASPKQQLLAAGRRFAANWNGGTSDAFDAGLDELEEIIGARFQAGDRYRLWDQALERQAQLAQ